MLRDTIKTKHNFCNIISVSIKGYVIILLEGLIMIRYSRATW